MSDNDNKNQKQQETQPNKDVDPPDIQLVLNSEKPSRDNRISLNEDED